MLLEYVQTAMDHAEYWLASGGCLGEIPGFAGARARARTLEDCRRALRKIVENCVVLLLSEGREPPAFRGARVTIPRRCARCGRPARSTYCTQECFLARDQKATVWTVETIGVLNAHFPKGGARAVQARLREIGVHLTLTAVQDGHKRHGTRKRKKAVMCG